jgi:hypothetical protein
MGSAGGERVARVRDRLDRAARLLERAAAVAAPALEDDAALRAEATRLRPRVEALVGRDYGALPRVRFRRGLGARLGGPWSQYLTLGHPRTRLVVMTVLPGSRGALPTILAHELAHRFSFDESLTTLRGLEVSARMAEEGDPMHAHAAPRELARLALGAAMADALEAGPEVAAEVDAFLGERSRDPALGRTRAQWARLVGRLERGRGVDCVTRVYSAIPCSGLEQAQRSGLPEAGPLPHPRFPLDSAQALAVAVYTGLDALGGRRRARTSIEATARLWEAAGQGG